MLDITYRTFGKEDCKDALAFWAKLPGVRLYRNGEDSIDGISTYLDRNPGFSFVAVQDDKIVGAVLCGHDGRRGFIHHLAVEPDFQRTGIGKRLLRLSTERLRAANIKKSAVFVLNENDVGEQFYKSLLWKEEDGVKVLSKVI